MGIQSIIAKYGQFAKVPYPKSFNRDILNSMLQRSKSFLFRYERRLSTFAFVFGFLWDNLTLTRVDRLFDNVVLSLYLVLAFGSICVINAHSTRLRRIESGLGLSQSGFFSASIGKYGASVARILLPFAFGGLFSGFLIFYSRSGEVLSSAPFLFLLIAFFFGNEFLQRHYQRFIFQMSVFFVALFSYASLLVPILLGRIGGSIFVVGGLVALILFWVALRAVSFFAREEVEENRYSLYAVVTIIFITFNFLYFNNMIPPIPLALKEIGIYHTVLRTRSGEYRLSFEKAPWYSFGKKTSAVFHRVENEPVYAFTSVFAPTLLDTEVLHRWSFFDETTEDWVSSTVIGFPISGGRKDGYRGYSVKENIFPGKWRVDVETLRGQIVGRFVFTVKDGGKSIISTEIAL